MALHFSVDSWETNTDFQIYFEATFVPFPSLGHETAAVSSMFLLTPAADRYISMNCNINPPLNLCFGSKCWIPTLISLCATYESASLVGSWTHLSFPSATGELRFKAIHFFHFREGGTLISLSRHLDITEIVFHVKKGDYAPPSNSAGFEMSYNSDG